MLALHNTERQNIQQWRSETCAKTEAVIQRLANRLVTRSGLEKIIEQQPKLTLAVACKKRTVALPELRGGVLWIYPDIIRGLKTEDHVAALLAHEIIHYTRSHEEERLSITETWMPFRESAVNRARWSQEQEADRLSLGLLTSAGFDPHAAADVPLLLDKFLAQETNWKEGQLDTTFGTMSDRSNRMTAELKYRRVRPSPQTPGEVAAVMAELNAR
jgi:predicted Zn-dependent protease